MQRGAGDAAGSGRCSAAPLDVRCTAEYPAAPRWAASSTASRFPFPPGGPRRATLAGVDAWPAFVTSVLARHGVADVRVAATHGISANRFFRRTARERWDAPSAGVRVHPGAPPSVQRSLLVVCSSSADVVAASGEAAGWLHGLRARPPERPTVVGRHAGRCPARSGVIVHRARWLTAADVVEAQAVPTLDVPSTLLTGCARPPDQQRAQVIDVLHRGLATAEAIVERCVSVGPIAGKGVLRELAEELGRLRVESVFQDDVAQELHRLGYPVERSTHRIATADGIGLTSDVVMLPYQVAVEPEGDTFHRTREQRRLDRRRAAAYAGTEWAMVPVDWRDWLLDREHVLAAIDAAIAAQRARGVGRGIVPPRP
jgi:hypothetical protein